jgi:hypothetical protein
MAIDFLKATKAEAEEFSYHLPKLLEEAAKRKPGIYILSKEEGVHENFYRLADGCVLVYQVSIYRKPQFGPVHCHVPEKKLTYKKFVKTLYLEDMIVIAKRLEKLGI